MNNPARFLSRWSRLKRQTAVEVLTAPEVVPGTGQIPLSVDVLKVDAQIDSGSDFSTLLREELSEAVRKQALKAIFADPHFNVMDGLDTYIDDYSISEPIPPEMLATLNQARFLFDNKEEAKVVDETTPDKLLPDCDNLDRVGQKEPDEPASELRVKDK